MNISLFKVSCLFWFIYLPISSLGNEGNSSLILEGVTRVVGPGIFDYQTSKYMVRMRAWGVGFPKRNQPGYENAINFTEKKLLGKNLEIDLKVEFDLNNLKVVDVKTQDSSSSFSRDAILEGVGWHLEKETQRHGFFVMAQMRAKRNSTGIWSKNYDYWSQAKKSELITGPTMKSIMENQTMLPTIRYWVTRFGKIHRPGCSFYEKGNGELSSRPTGQDCRICGGTKRK